MSNADPIRTSDQPPRPTHAPKRLPVYQAGGHRDPVFVALQRKERSIAAEVAGLSLDELRRSPLLSVNAKTSVSLDFPIGQTCDPTPVCAHICYGATPRAAATWRKSLRKRIRNRTYILLAPPDEAAARIAREWDRARRRWAPRARLDYLRINGTGDLFPELVPVINRLAAARPDGRIWVVTRRFELAAGLAPLPNLYLQLSLDASTPPELHAAALRLVETHPRAYFSFLRTRPDDDTRGAAIVFAEKRTKALPYHSKTDCPADAGRLPLDNVRGVGGTACARCRKCFSDATLARQRELLAGGDANDGTTVR